MAAPATPTSFSVSATPWLQINLSWAADGTEDHVEIERAPDSSGSPGTFAKIGETNRSDSNGTINVVHPLGHSPLSYYDDSVAANTIYWYRIRATNVDGNSSYTSNLSATSANPAASPSANAGSDFSIFLKEPATFDGLASSGVSAVSWDFGDNQGFPYSIAKNTLRPAHLYLAAGTYTATLTVRNSSGSSSSDTVQVTVTSIAAPTGAQLIDLSQSGANQITNLTDGSGNKTKVENALADANTASSSGHVRVVIPDGARINGTVTLPARSNNNYIQIFSVSAHQGTFTTGTRMTSAQSDAAPYFYSFTGGVSGLESGTSRHHYHFKGIKFTQPDSALTLFWYARLGDHDNETSAASVSHHFILEHCSFVCPSNREIQHGLYLFANDSNVCDSYFSNIKHVGSDSQAIAMHVGSRVTIVNNLLEGSSENIIIGGFSPGVQNAIPHSYTFKRNYFHKPLAWFPGTPTNANPSYAGTRYSVKNSFELKTGEDVVVAGNYYDRYWSDAQQYMVLIRAGSDSGNAQTSNIWFAYNKLSKMSQAIEVTSYENMPRGTRRCLVEHCVFEDIDPNRWYDVNVGVYSAPLIAIYNGGPDNQLIHNSFVKHSTTYSGQAMAFTRGDTMPKFVRFAFRDNIHYENGAGNGYYVYNFRAAQAGETGMSNSTDFAPAAVYLGNIYADGAVPPMPASGNYYPSLASFAANFVDYSGGNYLLAGSSAYKNGATDGTDPGADIALVNTAISGAAAGDWTETPPVVGVTVRAKLTMRVL